MKEQPAV